MSNAAVISINHLTTTVTLHGDDNLDIGSSMYAGAYWVRTSVEECQDLAEEISAILDRAHVAWSVEWP